MVSASTSGIAPIAGGAKEFFLARQPILNRAQELIAYELLFRGAAIGAANVVDGLSATASVMAHVCELGMENVVGNSLGFVNVDADVLMSDFVSFLPADKVVLEILESVTVTPELLARIEELAAVGYRFALDDVVVDNPDIQQLLPLAEFIKIDIMGMAPERIDALSAQFKQSGKKLLAEKVETVAEFEHCLALGFDNFQGYYFAKPVILSGKKIAPSQMTIMQLMNQIIADEDTAKLERTIKTDASLSLNLLRLVNSAGVGNAQRIDSLGQAMLVLGRAQLQRWLQILLYANPATGGDLKSPLLHLATTRGKLLELIAKKMYHGNRAMMEKSFTVGIMSLMDALFGVPMENILEKLSVADEVKVALLARDGVYGEMLRLGEYIERIDEAGPALDDTLHSLHLSVEDLTALQLAAFQWSNSIASGASA